MKKREIQIVVHKSAREAWDYFSKHCGIDGKGRDADFLEQLKDKLNPESPNLDMAIAHTTNDALVRGIFDCVAPFVAMSRDILAFFKRATVKKGAAQWALVVDDVPFELSNFLEFIYESQRIWGYFERPILDLGATHGLMEILMRNCPTEIAEAAKIRDKRQHFYNPWPEALEPNKLPYALQEVAQIGKTVLSQICQKGLTRVQILKSHGAILGPEAILNGQDLSRAESDLWLYKIIEGLYAAKDFSPDKLEFLGQDLAKIISPLSRILVPEKIDVGDLTKILSLPVWKRRNEVYAVWIATRLVDALPCDETIIHNENGEIRFAFRKTKIASVPCRSGDIVLFGERKQALANPIGHGRKRATQPDFGLWKEKSDEHLCALIVEVKHYAQAATRRFTEVLVDYAHAHPKAQVVLVNYGPTADMMDQLDTEQIQVRARCHHIANLTPLNAPAQQRLADFVADAMKRLSRQDRLLLIDVSCSMKKYLRDDSFRSWLEGVDNENVDRVIMFDCQERWNGTRDQAYRWICDFQSWSWEELASAARSMLGQSDQLYFVTDNDGLKDLEDANDLVVESSQNGLPEHLVLASVRCRA